MNDQKKYDGAIDILRIIAILAVILIHTTTKTLEISNFDLQKVPWTLFLNQISRFAVPVFFLISGFVLELNHSSHLGYYTYLKRRANRIFIPYVFWSTIYYFFVYKQHTESLSKVILSGDASYQLYFIPTLIIFYIIFPLIHRISGLFFKKWLVILLGALQFYLLYYDYYIHPLALFYPLRVALLNYYIFILGILAAHKTGKLTDIASKNKIILFILAVDWAVFIFLEGKSTYLKTRNYLSFYSQWRPSILIYSILFAAFSYYFLHKNCKNFFLVKILAKLSFFVFFAHVIVLEIIWYKIGIKIFWQTNGHIVQNLWYDPLFFIVVALISFFAAYIVHKIPYLAKLTS